MMLAALLTLAILGGTHAEADSEIQILDHPLVAPSPPVWPSSYEMQYTIELPYVASVQIVGLK